MVEWKGGEGGMRCGERPLLGYCWTLLGLCAVVEVGCAIVEECVDMIEKESD